MTKQVSYFFKVGAAVLLAATLFFVTLTYLKGYFNRSKHINVIFVDAHGMKSGDNVSMAGVGIGQVTSVGLTPDNKALAVVSINQGVPVPIESKFTIKGTILGSQSSLIIEPSKSPQQIPDGATVYGDSFDPLDETMSQGPKLISSLSSLLSSAKTALADTHQLVQAAKTTIGKLNDPNRIAKIDASLENIRESTARLPLLESEVQTDLATLSHQATSLLGSVNGTRASADQAIQNAGLLTKNLNSTLTENRGTIKSLLRDADDATSAVAGLTEQLKTSIGDKDLRANLVGTTANLQSISAKLDATASDVQRLADDPRVNSDVRETVANLRETSASVRDLAARVQGIHIPGERRRGPAPLPTPAPSASSVSLLEPGLVFDSVYDTKIERLRVDGDYTLLTGKKGSFYRAGIYDATYGNRFDLQAGQALFGNRFDYRYGLFAGKFGLGFDLRAGPLDFRMDAFDPNHGTLNARAKTYLNANTAITAGIDSVGRGNRATVGVQIRK